MDDDSLRDKLLYASLRNDSLGDKLLAYASLQNEVNPICASMVHVRMKLHPPPEIGVKIE